MASKKTKIQILDNAGNIVDSASVSTKSTLKTPEGLPVVPEFEKPLVTVAITNPFKKILYWLDQIRKHQTTTLAFKLSIPLIALPVIVAGVFSLGRYFGINTQKAVQAQTEQHASPSPQASPIAQLVEVSKAGTLKVAKGATATKYLLSLRNGEIVNLQIPDTIDLAQYSNKQVLVTGMQNKTTGVINVTDIAEVEVFNTTSVVPESNSPTPQATSSAN